MGVDYCWNPKCHLSETAFALHGSVSYVLLWPSQSDLLIFHRLLKAEPTVE